MNVEDLRNYCLTFAAAAENRPWTSSQYQMLVTFTVAGKWFCLLDPDKKFIDVKCSPEIIADMQSRYNGAFQAWHMNKEHWLGIELEADVKSEQIKELIKNGYEEVVAHLSAKKRAELKLL